MRTKRLQLKRARCANGGAKLDHGSGGMVPSRRSKTLPVCQPFPMMGRAGGFTREPASREADGAVSQGPSGVPGRDERARGGAPFRGLAREREEDARVLRSAGVPTHGAGAPSEARWVYRTHRRVAAGGSQGGPGGDRHRGLPPRQERCSARLQVHHPVGSPRCAYRGPPGGCGHDRGVRVRSRSDYLRRRRCAGRPHDELHRARARSSSCRGNRRATRPRSDSGDPRRTAPPPRAAHRDRPAASRRCGPAHGGEPRGAPAGRADRGACRALTPPARAPLPAAPEVRAEPLLPSGAAREGASPPSPDLAPGDVGRAGGRVRQRFALLEGVQGPLRLSGRSSINARTGSRRTSSSPSSPTACTSP